MAMVIGLLAVLVGLPGIGFSSLMTGAALTTSGLSPTQWHTVKEMGQLLLGVGLVAGAIGLISAWLVSIYEFPLRRWLEIGLALPLAFPTYLAAYVAVDLLDFFGPVQTAFRAVTGARTAADYAFPDIRTLGGAIFVLGLVLSPYVYLGCRIIFTRSGRSVIDAARLLGARGPRLFFRVGLPIAIPALVTGLVLAGLETLNDIGATEFLGVSSFSVAIRDYWLNRSDLPGAVRLAALLLVMVGFLLFLTRKQDGRRQPVTSRGGARPSRIPLRKVPGLLAAFAAGLPVLLGFLLPTGFLIWRAIQYAAQQRADAELLHAALSSLVLGVAVAGFVVAAGALVTIGIRIVPKLRNAGRLSTLGYAVPGTVLVLSIFPVMRWVDALAGSVGLSLAVSGTLAGITFALMVRFLGIGVTQSMLALDRLPRSIDWVARIHGMSDFRLAWRVHVPAMAPGLLIAAMLVFIDTVKELPATLLMRPLNFETLATRAYAQASAGVFEHAALESLAILALSGLAALILIRKS
ncbi:MAG: iron ABC transporter permease [Beijerinckiaceae bacterium]|nr:iron ABC transporter permease [Beijerinckiaceae bacterium]